MKTKRDESAIVADQIREKHALGAGLQRFATGSVPVYAAGDKYVLKLFPAGDQVSFQTESAALARIDGSLSIPTPRVVALGDHSGWSYIAMTRLPGQSLVEAWPAIPAEDRYRLMRDVGAALADLHDVSTDDLAPLAVDWSRFMTAQRTSCRERQTARGLGSPWVEHLDEFLSRCSPRDDGRRVLLHTEVMREHLLVECLAGGWRLSGLIDFEPAMVGAPEYEFAAVGVFLTCAEPGLLRPMLDAYGMPCDEALPLRLMTYTLLHRFSNLPRYLERLPVPEVPGDLEVLARRWFTP